MFLSGDEAGQVWLQVQLSDRQFPVSSSDLESICCPFFPLKVLEGCILLMQTLFAKGRCSLSVVVMGSCFVDERSTPIDTAYY